MSSTTQYEATLHEVIRLGGCNVSRSIFAGACIDALEESPPPKKWMKRFSAENLEELEGLARALADIGE